MAYETRDLAVRILGDSSSFKAATKDVTGASEDAQSGFEKFSAGAKKASLVLAGVSVGLTAYSKNATDYTENLVKQSTALGREIGVNTSEASRLSAAMERMGIDADNTQQMFGIFSKQINKAANATESDRLAKEALSLQIKKTQQDIADTTAEIKKNGDKTGELTLKVDTLKNTLATLQDQQQASANAFDQLGISTQKADGTQKNFVDILGETADKFKEMPNGVTKTSLAMELFGKQGKDMVKVLNLGSAGINDLEKQADKLGLTLSVDTITKVNDLVQAQKDLKESTDAMKIAVGTATAPVLAQFQQKMNSVVLALLNTHGPLKTITTDVLAFGGPIAGAASGFLGLVANIDQALPALKGMMGIMGSLVGLLQGPWGLAIAAASLGIAVLLGHFMHQTDQTQQLKNAQDALVTSTNNVTTAQNNLTNSQLALRGASLGVEGAQRSYNQAVAQFGPQSYEARDALYNLQVAQQQLKDAQDRTKQSQDDLAKAQKKVADDKSLINHLKDLQDQTEGIGSSALKAGEQIQRLDGSKVTVKTSTNKDTGVQNIDFVSTFGKRAKGGPVNAGESYIVGEKGMEIFTPTRDGSIIPNDKLNQTAPTAAPAAAQAAQAPVTIDLDINVGMYAGMPVEKREIALELWKELTRAARAQGVQLPMIGAVGVQ